MQVAGVNLPRANKRLTALYNETLNLAEEDDIVADVGADHGYLSAMLAKSNKFRKVIATDISAPSLKKTTVLAESLNLSIETRVGDGLTVAPDATLACICGMGGYEIIKILETYPQTTKFVFQPVQNPTELRAYLLKNKFNIVKDYVLVDKGKTYFVITVAGKGKNKYSKLDKLFGKGNMLNKTPDFVQHLQNEVNKLNFLEKFDIKSVEHKQRRELKRKQRYYKLCKKILKREV